MEIDYSVIIRTTGKAGQKYAGLLAAIDGLVPKPKEVIVVLPEGYELPAEKLGWETFYFSPKGMVIQRMVGIQKCRTQYALVCDDDVKFPPDFVEKLYQPIKDGLCRISAGPLYSFLPPKGANAALCTIMSSATPTLFHRQDRYISVLRSSGYSYNRHLESGRFYETQSVAWTCFFAEISAIQEIDFMAESWLDSHGYSALDDQTMFYKAWLNGIKTIVVSDAKYEHLDARTSTRNNKPAAIYSGTFNRVVFWHRFIYSQEKTIFGKLMSKVAFAYRMLWIRIWNVILVWRHRMTREEYQIARKGFLKGFEYIQSVDYKNLPSI